MIHTNRVVTVGDQESIIDKPIVLYRGDREVEVEFELVGNEFMFTTEGNVIKSVNASHGQLVLNTPSGDNMFSELAECHDGKVVFVITKEMIDEFIEMGFYSFQIRLYDGEQMKSRVTIPPVFSGLDIRNPIAAEDETNVVDQAVVDYARIYRDQSNEELPTFAWDGEYNKTDWLHHDVITENKMNKIEDAIWTVNNKISESDNVFLKKAEQMEVQRQNDVNKLNAKDTQLTNDIQNVNRNLTNAVNTLRVDMEVADEAVKRELTEYVVDELSVLDDFNTRLNYVANSVNVKEKMGQGLSATEAFKAAIKEAYYKSYNNTGWRSPIVIEIPSGEYVIEDTLIDSSTGVNGGRFVFKGDGYQNTKIKFNPSEEKFLFSNTGVFGFTIFEGISFQSNGIGKFMHGQGGGTGNAQGFIFEKCRFDDWFNIIYATGNSMMSEVTFRDCRITGGGKDSVMFHLNNSQAVNWRFIATDIESFYGTMIEMVQGTTVTFLQGSIIPLDGTVISIPVSANPDTFGSTNNPCIQMNGSRFELRGKSFLVKALNEFVSAVMVFTNCGMGGFNLTNTDADRHYTLDLAMRGSIKFIDCYNMRKFSVKDVWQNGSSFLHPKEIIFDHCDVDIDNFLSTSTSIDTAGNYNNAQGCGKVIYNNHVYIIRDIGMFFRDKPLVTTFYRQDPADALAFTWFNPTITTDHEIKGFNRKTIYGVSLYIYSLAAYGAINIHVRVLNKAKTRVFMEGDFAIDKSSVITANCAPYYVGVNDGLIMELTSKTTTSHTNIRFLGTLAIQHQ